MASRCITSSGRTPTSCQYRKLYKTQRLCRPTRRQGVNQGMGRLHHEAKIAPACTGQACQRYAVPKLQQLCAECRICTLRERTALGTAHHLKIMRHIVDIFAPRRDERRPRAPHEDDILLLTPWRSSGRTRGTAETQSGGWTCKKTLAVRPAVTTCHCTANPDTCVEVRCVFPALVMMRPVAASRRCPRRRDASQEPNRDSHASCTRREGSCRRITYPRGGGGRKGAPCCHGRPCAQHTPIHDNFTRCKAFFVFFTSFKAHTFKGACAKWPCLMCEASPYWCRDVTAQESKKCTFSSRVNLLPQIHENNS